MHQLQSLFSKVSQQFQLSLKRNFRGGNPTSIYLFQLHLPTLRPWSQTLQEYAVETVEAVKYPLQRRQMLITCHNMIKIMFLKKCFMLIMSPPPPPVTKLLNRHCICECNNKVTTPPSPPQPVLKRPIMGFKEYPLQFLHIARITDL